MKELMKRILKRWHSLNANMTALYKILLGVLSIALALACFFSLFFLFYFQGDAIYVTELRGEEYVSILNRPLHISAIMIASVIVTAWGLELPLTTIVSRVTIYDKKEKYDLGGVTAAYITAVAFDLFVFLGALYSSVVLSLILYDGKLVFLVMLFSVIFLSSYAKRLLAPFVIRAYRRSIESKRIKRIELCHRDEDGNEDMTLKSVTVDLEKGEYPALADIVKRAAKGYGFTVESLKIGMTYAENVKRKGKRLSFTLDLLQTSVLTEDQLFEALSFECYKKKVEKKYFLFRFDDLVKAIRFSTSNWNPIEKIYDPINRFCFVEKSRSDISLQSLPFEYAKVAADGGKHLKSANERRKLLLLSSFAMNEGLLSSLLESEEPTTGYPRILRERFFEYVKEKDITSHSELDLTKEPSGDYLDDINKLSDVLGVMLAESVKKSYAKKRRIYRTLPLERIASLDRRIAEKQTVSADEMVSVAYDAVTLGKNKYAARLLKMAESTEDKDEKTVKALSRLKKMLLTLSESANEALLRINGAEKQNEEDLSDLFFGREFSSFVFNPAENKKSGKWAASGEYTDVEKKHLADELSKICGDRLLWAAVFTVNGANERYDTLIVGCNEFSRLGYDCFRKGIYIADIDSLTEELLILVKRQRGFMRAALSYEPYPAFAPIFKDAFIYSKSSLELDAIFSHYDKESDEDYVLDIELQDGDGNDAD